VFEKIRQWRTEMDGIRLRDLWWAVQVTGMLLVVPVIKHRLAVPTLVRLFDARPRPGGGGDWRRLNRIVKGLLRRTHRKDYCLPYSLILFHFCRKWGHSTRIFIGARKGEDGLAGHAWVLIDGEPVPGLTPVHDAYTTFFVYPEPTA